MTRPGRSLLGVAMLGSWLACASSTTQSEPGITPTRAVELAEQFIERNGYTEKPGRLPLTYESIERGGSDEEILELRRGTLSPRAYGYLCGGGGCFVVFRFTGELADDSVGRVVTMDAQGRELRVEHKDFFLSATEVVLDAR